MINEPKATGIEHFNEPWKTLSGSKTYSRQSGRKMKTSIKRDISGIPNGLCLSANLHSPTRYTKRDNSDFF